MITGFEDPPFNTFSDMGEDSKHSSLESKVRVRIRVRVGVELSCD